jgi:prepilin-type N-terminal cleavage/methylation domain-containing protein
MGLKMSQATIAGLTAPSQYKPKSSGFTLVELSIVLVIIGLIVGGVVGGQSLVSSARISAQAQQLTKFETAYNAFKLQYDAVSGDMYNASDYWPGATNGDGNNRITEDANNAGIVSRENVKFFEHLSRAKIIPETYTNVWTLGQGYPALKVDEGKGMIAAGQLRGGACCQVSANEAQKQHIAVLYLNVGSPNASGASSYNDSSGVTPPSIAKSIDKKLDDGTARTGKFKAHSSEAVTNGLCLDGADGDYLVSNDNVACMAEYILE